MLPLMISASSWRTRDEHIEPQHGHVVLGRVGAEGLADRGRLEVNPQARRGAEEREHLGLVLLQGLNFIGPHGRCRPDDERPAIGLKGDAAGAKPGDQLARRRS